MVFKIKSEIELSKVAKEILKQDRNVMLLCGDLGAGKTTLTKYIARELGIKDNVSSPTFILHSEYKIPKSNRILHHLDLYRLDSEIELAELKIKDLANKNNIVIIEWADKFNDYMKSVFVEGVFVTFSQNEIDCERTIKLSNI